MESRGPEDSKNVKTSQAYFFEGFILFFEDFSLTKTDVRFGNDRGRRPRLLQNPNLVFDICTNTSNKLFISNLL